MRKKEDHLNNNTNNERRDAIAGWEDEGGAASSKPGRQTDISRREADPPGAERDRLDANHDSDARGEHRYPDTHQTRTERNARRERDDLKRSLERQRGSSGKRR